MLQGTVIDIDVILGLVFDPHARAYVGSRAGV